MASPVERWLETFMCKQYAKIFESYGYKTLQSVCQLDRHQLCSMGVLPEHIEKIAENVSVLKQSFMAKGQQVSPASNLYPVPGEIDPVVNPASTALMNMSRKRDALGMYREDVSNYPGHSHHPPVSQPPQPQHRNMPYPQQHAGHLGGVSPAAMPSYQGPGPGSGYGPGPPPMFYGGYNEGQSYMYPSFSQHTSNPYDGQHGMPLGPGGPPTGPPTGPPAGPHGFPPQSSGYPMAQRPPAPGSYGMCSPSSEEGYNGNIGGQQAVGPGSSTSPSQPPVNAHMRQPRENPQQVADTILHMASQQHQYRTGTSISSPPGHGRMGGHSNDQSPSHMPQHSPAHYNMPHQPQYMYQSPNSVGQSPMRSPMNIQSPSSDVLLQNTSPGMCSYGAQGSGLPEKSPAYSCVSSPGIVGMRSPTSVPTMRSPAPHPIQQPSPANQTHGNSVMHQSHPAMVDHFPAGHSSIVVSPPVHLPVSSGGYTCSVDDPRYTHPGYTSPPASSVHVTRPTSDNPPSFSGSATNPLMSLQKLVLLPETQVVDPKSVVNDACLGSEKCGDSFDNLGDTEDVPHYSSDSNPFNSRSMLQSAQNVEDSFAASAFYDRNQSSVSPNTATAPPKSFVELKPQGMYEQAFCDNSRDYNEFTSQSPCNFHPNSLPQLQSGPPVEPVKKSRKKKKPTKEDLTNCTGPPVSKKKKKSKMAQSQDSHSEESGPMIPVINESQPKNLHGDTTASTDPRLGGTSVCSEEDETEHILVQKGVRAGRKPAVAAVVSPKSCNRQKHQQAAQETTQESFDEQLSVDRPESCESTNCLDKCCAEKTSEENVNTSLCNVQRLSNQLVSDTNSGLIHSQPNKSTCCEEAVATRKKNIDMERNYASSNLQCNLAVSELVPSNVPTYTKEHLQLEDCSDGKANSTPTAAPSDSRTNRNVRSPASTHRPLGYDTTVMEHKCATNKEENNVALIEKLHNASDIIPNSSITSTTSSQAWNDSPRSCNHTDATSTQTDTVGSGTSTVEKTFTESKEYSSENVDPGVEGLQSSIGQMKVPGSKCDDITPISLARPMSGNLPGVHETLVDCKQPMLELERILTSGDQRRRTKKASNNNNNKTKRKKRANSGKNPSSQGNSLGNTTNGKCEAIPNESERRENSRILPSEDQISSLLPIKSRSPHLTFMDDPQRTVTRDCSSDECDATQQMQQPTNPNGLQNLTSSKKKNTNKSLSSVLSKLYQSKVNSQNEETSSNITSSSQQNKYLKQSMPEPRVDGKGLDVNIDASLTNGASEPGTKESKDCEPVEPASSPVDSVKENYSNITRPKKKNKRKILNPATNMPENSEESFPEAAGAERVRKLVLTNGVPDNNQNVKSGLEADDYGRGKRKRIANFIPKYLELSSDEYEEDYSMQSQPPIKMCKADQLYPPVDDLLGCAELLRISKQKPVLSDRAIQATTNSIIVCPAARKDMPPFFNNGSRRGEGNKERVQKSHVSNNKLVSNTRHKRNSIRGSRSNDSEKDTSVKSEPDSNGVSDQPLDNGVSAGQLGAGVVTKEEVCKRDMYNHTNEVINISSSDNDYQEEGVEEAAPYLFDRSSPESLTLLDSLHAGPDTYNMCTTPPPLSPASPAGLSCPNSLNNSSKSLNLIPSASSSKSDSGKKKRGRPFGSKVKDQHLKRRGKQRKRHSKNVDDEDYLSDTGIRDPRLQETVKRLTSASRKKLNLAPNANSKKTSVGPFLRVQGPKDAPDSCELKNTSECLSEKTSKKRKSRHERYGEISSSSSVKFVDFVPFQCAFCGHGSHYKDLGDLYGPYYAEAHSPHSSQRSPSPSERHRRLSKDSLNDSSSKRGVGRRQSDSCESPCKGSPNHGLPDEIWIHENCIVWSSGIYASRGRLHGLEEALLISSQTVCSLCRKTGASLGCLRKGCPLQYHYMCAEEAGCHFNAENFSLICPEHKDKQHKNLMNSVCPWS